MAIDVTPPEQRKTIFVVGLGMVGIGTSSVDSLLSGYILDLQEY
jgi:hypothetical protein